MKNYYILIGANKKKIKLKNQADMKGKKIEIEIMLLALFQLTSLF